MNFENLLLSVWIDRKRPDKAVLTPKALIAVKIFRSDFKRAFPG